MQYHICPFSFFENCQSQRDGSLSNFLNSMTRHPHIADSPMLLDSHSVAKRKQLRVQKFVQSQGKDITPRVFLNKAFIFSNEKKGNLLPVKKGIFSYTYSTINILIIQELPSACSTYITTKLSQSMKMFFEHLNAICSPKSDSIFIY